jgi:hypothetical protein
MTIQRVSAVYQPTRADQRGARQIIADLREGEASPALDRIAAGPLDGVIRFLAGCGLCFQLIGWDERGRLHASGGPTAESVALLVDRLLARVPPPPPAGPPPGLPADASLPLAAAAHREPWIEAAVDQVVDGLHQRDLSFILGWRLPGRSHVRLDHVFGADRAKVDEYLRWFSRERLGIHVDVTVASDASAMATVGGPT